MCLVFSFFIPCSPFVFTPHAVEVDSGLVVSFEVPYEIDGVGVAFGTDSFIPMLFEPEVDTSVDSFHSSFLSST